MKLLIIILHLVAWLISECSGQETWLAYGEYEYYISTNTGSIDAAKSGCRGLDNDAVVASIKSEDIQIFLMNKLQSSTSEYFLGAQKQYYNDPIQPRDFYWFDDGSPIDYHNFVSPEPDDNPNPATCVVLDASDGKWKTENCYDQPKYHICQRDNPNPPVTETPSTTESKTDSQTTMTTKVTTTISTTTISTTVNANSMPTTTTIITTTTLPETSTSNSVDSSSTTEPMKTSTTPDSHISISSSESDIPPTSNSADDTVGNVGNFSVELIAGAAAGGVIVVLLVTGGILFWCKRKKKPSRSKDNKEHIYVNKMDLDNDKDKVLTEGNVATVANYEKVDYLQANETNIKSTTAFYEEKQNDKRNSYEHVIVNTAEKETFPSQSSKEVDDTYNFANNDDDEAYNSDSSLPVYSFVNKNGKMSVKEKMRNKELENEGNTGNTYSHLTTKKNEESTDNTYSQLNTNNSEENTDNTYSHLNTNNSEENTDNTYSHLNTNNSEENTDNTYSHLNTTKNEESTENTYSHLNKNKKEDEDLYNSLLNQ